MSTVDDLFRQRMRAARKRAGMSQRQIADGMKRRGFDQWHQTTAAKIENENRTVSVGEAVAIAHVLGVPVGALIEGYTSEEESTWEDGRKAGIAESQAALTAADDAVKDLRVSLRVAQSALSAAERTARHLSLAPLAGGTR